MASGYYDITNKTLGKGHYGVVKLGRHCLTGEPVAIKIIEKSRLNNDSLNQLGTEIRILFRLSEYEHPNILKLYQTIDTEDKLFLVTEYCGPHACDLHDYLSRKHSRDGLNEKEAQIFFIQICSAISYCHSMGIVHRDLKPENILVTDYKTRTDHKSSTKPPDENHHYPLLKLIDFGFANQLCPDEKMRTSCGTLAYSAPELLLGEPYDGTKVDVWGLGLMLYILLYGGNPFMQINDNETLTKILDCSFATPTRNNVDNNAIELLRSLIKRNPDTRLPIDAILRHKWFSGVTNPIELKLKYQIRTQEQPCAKQLQTKMAPVVSSTLPSISESRPLKNFNRSVDDHQVSSLCQATESSEILKPNYNRTRSLSITRIHCKPVQQQSLPQTRSSINLGRLSHQQINNNNNTITLSPLTSPTTTTAPPATTTLRNPSIYRPTSPDVGGFMILSEEEKKLHDTVIQEMFRLTKLIDSRSSIEASLKNARFTHRLFNQNSIQPTQYNKKKTTTHSLAKSLIKQQQISTQQTIGADALLQTTNQTNASNNKGSADKLGIINSKLTNDDYIYATYQLTRDRIIRVKHNQRGCDQNINSTTTSTNHLISRKETPSTTSTNQISIPEEEILEQNELDGKQINATDKNIDRVSVKENEGKLNRAQRKLLQPQHKMRDKFTSFFRTGSTSPNNSINISCDISSSGSQQNQTHLDSSSTLGTLTNNNPISLLSGIDIQQHEAFSDHNNDLMSGSAATSRYFGIKQDSCDNNSMTFALPLARKCSLVSEESGCSNELPDN